MMLFPEDTFKTFASNSIANTKVRTEVLFNIDAQSKEAVDEIAKKVESAGGKSYAEPAEVDGWMYVCGFEDLDGHRWSVLYMEMDKMPQQSHSKKTK